MVGNPDFLTGSGQDQAPEFQELETPEGELHLRFFVPSSQEFALPATGIREVLSISPDWITAIPNSSPLLLGTINFRGQVIWVSDLGQFLGDTTMLNTDRPEINIIVIEDQETMLGLAIDRIGEMDWLDPEQLQMPNNVPDSMAPFLRGEWLLDEESNRYLLLLEQVAILRSARWAA
ncbi:MAG: chemotaxis protein CheW [Symploca sp. SIO2E6]|nr:chemotaxis protein CheW [Symploca sp. SIO2E6]